MATGIEWCDETWNPVTGCAPISEGCDHCWAQRMAKRLRGRYGYYREIPFAPTLHADRLEKPTRWRRPRWIFVCSMGDLFHEDVPDEWIDQVFSVMTHPMGGANHHVYMLLTKRPARILKGHAERFAEWPHIWLGVSVENQARADERIPILLEIPAAVRFISVEPMLGPVILSQGYVDYLAGWHTEPEHAPGCNGSCYSCPVPVQVQDDGLDWVVCGAETGPGARPMELAWARSLRDQCQAEGVPFFFKRDSDGCRELDGVRYEEFPE